MMRPLIVLALMLPLLGCGADGEPIPPEPKRSPGPGVQVSVTGSAEMGIAKR